jgi:hypothetical protein
MLLGLRNVFKIYRVIFRDDQDRRLVIASLGYCKREAP